MKYQFDPAEFSVLESLKIPLAVYQFINKRVVTLLLSDAFCELLGYEDKAQAYHDMDHDMYRDVHPDDAIRIENEAYRFATKGGTYNVVYRTYSKADNAYRILHAFGKHVYPKEGVRLAYIWYTDEGIYDSESHDELLGLTSELSSALHQSSIIKSSYFDELTGLPSMSYFFDLADEWRKSQLKKSPAALIYMDICGMKHYNRKYGFAEGDRLLRTFANLLKRYFGNENCSRLGSDHFCAIAPGEGIEDVLKKIFEEFCNTEGYRAIPVRTGIYIDEDGAENISSGYDRAKYACDSLSNIYKSRYTYFDANMMKKVDNTTYIIDNLDTALNERWIDVYFQPIIRAANGRVCNEEALARWIDPVKGILPPFEFIPILEEAKLIYKIDLYVAERILEKMELQKNEGLVVVPTSVNLSRVDFEACDMVEEIRRRVDDAGISRSLLCIEITESAVGGEFEFMKKQIDRFRELGFPVWMDDFGSGYSSLDLLQSVRFDLIKFDMRFMKEFSNGNKSRIILTELMRMAIALDIDTVCEGVETKEQVEFLREIGCTKLQGYYYIPPIPIRDILMRYRSGTQIGFENPLESDYYAAIGKINLYDLAVFSGDAKETFEHYFNTLPMAVMETNDSSFRLVRCNISYRTFMENTFHPANIGEWYNFEEEDNKEGGGFLRMMKECADNGGKLLIDEEMPDNTVMHAFIKRIAVNPVNGNRAVAVALLAITDKKDAPLTFAEIAKALSSDYMYLYYVNLETENFVEYKSDSEISQIAVERHGTDFFAESRRDANVIIHEKDNAAFIEAFTKENVLNSIDVNGAFTSVYRLLINGVPTYVELKAVRSRTDSTHIIIGVNNIDSRIREKEAMERMKAEQITYSRVAALSGNFVCIYTIDPETDHYIQYTATKEYSALDTPVGGKDFFGDSLREIPRVIHPDDLEYFRANWSKENILRDIREKGLFRMRYRLNIDGRLTRVTLKAAMVQEIDGPQLIIGIFTSNSRNKKEPTQ